MTRWRGIRRGKRGLAPQIVDVHASSLFASSISEGRSGGVPKCQDASSSRMRGGEAEALSKGMNEPVYPQVPPHASRAQAVEAFWAVLAPYLVSEAGEAPLQAA